MGQSARRRRYPESVPKTVVIETRTVPVLLGAPGFDSSVIGPPTFAVERTVRGALSHPARADARWFVSTLLAGCLVPSRRVSEIEDLTEPDRARLRRALVDACEERRCWRALYGSHLSADERLLAVMVWRHRRYGDEAGGIIAALVARRAELARTVESASEEMVSRRLVADLGGIARLYRNILQPYSMLSAGFGLKRPWQLDVVRGAIETNQTLAQLNIGTDFASTRGLLAVDGAPWMKALANTQANIGVLAANRTLLGAASLSAGYARLPGSIPSILTAVESFGRQLHLMQDTMRWHEETDQFLQRWERDALWLLFLHVGVGAAHSLASLSRAEVEAIVLLALETIYADGKYIPALREAVAVAPYVTPSQRTHLDHMLEHAEQGEYVKASGSLYLGLEGAYREAAYATTAATRPTGTKKALGFEKVVKLMDLPTEVQTFMVRAIFGGTGNTVRHGAADGIERRQVLLGVAALAAWLELFADAPALDVLGDYLTAALPTAREQRQPLALTP